MPDFSQFSIDSLTRMDIAALIVLGMSALWGLTRGLATELSGLVAWVAAVLLALRYHAVLEPFLSSYIKESWLLSGASDLIVFVVLLLFFSSIAARVGNAARNSLLGGVDRILGAAFRSAARLFRSGGALSACRNILWVAYVISDAWKRYCPLHCGRGDPSSGLSATFHAATSCVSRHKRS